MRLKLSSAPLNQTPKPDFYSRKEILDENKNDWNFKEDTVLTKN